MIRNYFKIALRNLARHKIYGLINVMGLAMSMACGIVIFTLVKYHLSFDNFHKDSQSHLPVCNRTAQRYYKLCRKCATTIRKSIS